MADLKMWQNTLENKKLMIIKQIIRLTSDIHRKEESNFQGSTLEGSLVVAATMPITSSDDTRGTTYKTTFQTSVV